MLEDLGVLVFQTSDVPVEEVRGFSINEPRLPVIVLNAKDSIRGRIFTLFHELGHLLLGKGGVCDLEELPFAASSNQRIEVFCNRVAGATLVPARALEQDVLVGSTQGCRPWEESELKQIANRFSVSTEVVLTRLVITGRASTEFYQHKREQYVRARARSERRTGFAPPFRRTLSSVGRRFARTVLSAYHEGIITASDVSEYLDLRLKHLARLEQEIMRQPASRDTT